VTDFNQLQAVLEPYKIYSDILKASLDSSLGRSLDDLLYEYEVKLCVQAFDGQSHFASFYAYVKLKKQEERNIKWIIQCIHQRRDQKDFNKWIKIF
jgi:V-type H+-transporting ATPase subunit d